VCGHDQRSSPEVSIHSGILSRPENIRRDKSRPKLIWEETVKRDLKELNITKELTLDRSVWKMTIHVEL
jgi:hypothetical protein